MAQFAAKIRSSIEKVYEWMFGHTRERMAEEILDTFEKLGEIRPIPTTSKEELEEWLRELEEKLRKKGSPELVVPLTLIYEKILDPLLDVFFITDAAEMEESPEKAMGLIGTSVAAGLGWSTGLAGVTCRRRSLRGGWGGTATLRPSSPSLRGARSSLPPISC